MRIDKIRIQNFKGFEDETFELNPRFTVFIGENGAGKTSVLDALAISMNSYFLGVDIKESPWRNIEFSEIRVSTIDNEPRPQFPTKIIATGKIDRTIVQDGWNCEMIEVTPPSAFFAGVRETEVTKIAKRMVSKSRSEGGITFPVIAYHGTGRLWAEHREEHPEFRKQEEGISMAYRNCLSPKSSSQDFLSWYKTYQYEVDKFGKEEDKLQIRIFNQCILSFIPGHNWESMTFSFKDEDLIFSDNEETLLFSQLSDGYRNVIGMVADIAYRCIKLNPHLGENAIKETPGLVLIDELDLHLHPNWQRRIVSDLKKAFPKVQFVATTHSPFIVQSLKADELVILDDDGIKEGDPFKKSIEEIAEDEMGVDDMPRSAEFLEMQKTAEEYYKLIAEGKTSKNNEKTRELRKKLNELEEKFGEDAAFIAALKVERQAGGL